MDFSAVRRAATPPHIPRREPLRRVRSPRLADVNPADTERFWAEIAHEGTPMIEASENPGTELMTFLWREPEESARHVLLIAGKITDPFAPAETVLAPIPGTDIRALTLELPDTWVGSYLLAPLQALPQTHTALGQDEVRAAMAAGVPDPLCHARIRPKPDAGEFSLGAGSAATPRPAFGPGAGCSGVIEVDSDALGERRVARSYLPAGVTEPVCLAVFLDGEVWEHRLPAVLDRLTAEGGIPPLTAVFVDSLGPAQRQLDYTARAAFRLFLAEEIPAALALNPRGRGHLIVGQSFGGLCALMTASEHPDVFAAVIAQSGSFWWPSATLFESGRNAMAQRAADPATVIPERIVLEGGLLEWDVRDDLRRVRDVLTARGAAPDVREYAGGHDIAWWERTLPDALVRASDGLLDEPPRRADVDRESDEGVGGRRAG